MTVQTTSYQLSGGMDQVTPGIQVSPGAVLDAQNYEPSPDGYRRIEGYERFDGQMKPSDAKYWLLTLNQAVTGVFVGDTITGATNGGAGKALVIRGTELVLWDVSGSFAIGETVKHGETEIGLITKDVHDNNALYDTDDRDWKRSVRDAARARITDVPGSGPIRGVFGLKGRVYAWRDGEDQGKLFRSSDTGWQEMNTGQEITFDAGTAAFEEGETVSGGSSGASATIIRMIVEEGAWANQNAKGRLVLSDVQGVFNDNESLTSAAGAATADGVARDNLLPLGGHYRAFRYNFYGQVDSERLYVCNGIGEAFELIDGTVCFLKTGVEDRYPKHIAAYKNHLFLGFEGGSLMHSGVGEPHAWTAVLGAGEMATGEEITGLLAPVRDNLVVFGRNKISNLTGSSPLDWVLREFGDETGAIEGSVQKMFDPIFLDDRGVRSLSTTEQYGDFKIGSYSKNIDPYMKSKRGKVSCSLRVRKKDQYRIFFTDGSGLILDISKGQPEFMPIQLPFSVQRAASIEDSLGEEMLLITGDDGYVYEMDAGVSFDGDAIDAYLRLPFVNLGSPTQNKRFIKATIEVDAEPNTDLQFTADFSYGNPDLPAHDEQAFEVSGAGAFWDTIAWNDFYWSSQIEGIAEAHLDGLGTNLSMVIMSSSDTLIPHSLHGVTLHWSPRGLKR